MFKFLAAWVLFVTVAFGGTRTGHKGKGHAVSPELAMKIYNGMRTSIKKIPYQISLGYGLVDGSIMFSYEHFCGGSIIADYWVITAGHCLIGRSVRNVNFILAGSSENKGQYSSWHRINRKVTHPQYYVNRQGVPSNDIALIRVAQSFVFRSYRQRVPIHTGSSDVIVGNRAVVSGWGMNELGNYPSKLYSLELPIVAKSVCKSHYGSAFSLYGQICGGQYKVNQGICSGDSGGPLISKGVLVGVVSLGPEPCSLTWYPSVYTDVGYYSNWIIRVISN